jgi:hypothetical protein
MTPTEPTRWSDGIRWDEPPDAAGLPAVAQTVLRRLDTEAGVRQLGWTITALVAVALVIVIGRGGSTPQDPKVVINQGPTATVTTRPAPASPPGQP